MVLDSLVRTVDEVIVQEIEYRYINQTPSIDIVRETVIDNLKEVWAINIIYQQNLYYILTTV